MIHQTARLLCFVSAGELLVHQDGTFEIAPLSLWKRKGGGFIFRVGRNTYWFNADGAYDGPECMLDAKTTSPDRNKAVMEALATCKDNRHHAPPTAYFPPDAPGWKDETALWPAEARESTKREHAPPREPEPVREAAVHRHPCLMRGFHDVPSGIDITAVQPESVSVESSTVPTGETVATLVFRHGPMALGVLMDGGQARELRDALDAIIPKLTPVVAREDTRN